MPIEETLPVAKINSHKEQRRLSDQTNNDIDKNNINVEVLYASKHELPNKKCVVIGFTNFKYNCRNIPATP